MVFKNSCYNLLDIFIDKCNLILIMPLIFKNKFLKIGIVFLAINLLACSRQPDFKDIYRLAEKGDTGAQAKLGELYVEGTVVPQDYKKAFELYSKAANQGNAEAQNNLGAMYALGQGVDQNYKKAFEWYSKAAEQGEVKAQNNLGAYYANGDGGVKNYQKAFEWYNKAAAQDNAEAKYYLGILYEEGYGVTQDYKKLLSGTVRLLHKIMPMHKIILQYFMHKVRA